MGELPFAGIYAFKGAVSFNLTKGGRVESQGYAIPDVPAAIAGPSVKLTKNNVVTTPKGAKVIKKSLPGELGEIIGLNVSQYMAIGKGSTHAVTAVVQYSASSDQSPNTDDDSNMLLFCGAGFMALILMAGVALVRREQ